MFKLFAFLILLFATGPAVAQTAAVPEPGELFRDCPDCPEMVVVPAGEFDMGGKDSPYEGPQHRVTIAKPFAIERRETSFAEWDACVSDGKCKHRPDDRGWGRGDQPVIDVSWEDAKAFVLWLTQKTGRNYRLPSEAEWEYAARANSKTRYHFGDDEAKLCEFGNGADRTSAFLWGNHLCSDNVGVQTAEVGRYRPNSFGVHDMIGNASEWVMDCSNANYVDAPVDGTAWMSGDCQKRVIRGGSWDSGPKDLRSATRGAYPMQGKDNIGFRIARDIVKP